LLSRLARDGHNHKTSNKRPQLTPRQ